MLQIFAQFCTASHIFGSNIRSLDSNVLIYTQVILVVGEVWVDDNVLDHHALLFPRLLGPGVKLKNGSRQD